MSLIALSAVIAVVVSVFGEKERGKSPATLAVEADLHLETGLSNTPATIMPGERISIKMKVINRSVDRTHRLIKPNDGSELGLREPHLFYKVDWQDTDGSWKEAPRLAFVRDCGLFAERWTKDFVDLAPGESLDCSRWAPGVAYFFEFQKAGRYRIFSNYRYGTNYDGTTRTPNQRFKLDEDVRGIPNFTLTSKPIYLKLERSLELLLKQKREVDAGQENSLKDLFEVELMNQSTREFEVSSYTPHGNLQLRFELHQDGEEAGHQRVKLSGAPDARVVKKLGEKDSLILFGSGDFGKGSDGTWTFPKAGRQKIRAVYYLTTLQPAFRLASDWIEIAVGERG